VFKKGDRVKMQGADAPKRVAFHGGIVNHGSEGAADWSIHT